MLTVTVAFVEKVAPEFPVHIAQFPVDERIAWAYYHEDNEALMKCAKTLMGIPSNVPTFRGAFTEYLVDPSTGRHLHNDDMDVNDFIASVYSRKAELIREHFNPSRKQHREFFFPVPV